MTRQLSVVPKIDQPAKPEKDRTEDRLLDLSQICDILLVKPSWCYNNKVLPWVKVGGLKRLWLSDLNEYLKSRRSPPKGYHVKRHDVEPNPNVVDEFMEAMD